MSSSAFVTADEIRTRFARAMSDMYRAEVPHYGTLLDLVAEVNAAALAADPALAARTGDLGRLALERHGAIRLGTPAELATVRRLFAVMGLLPVGYYDLSAAGVPVHATAFRPVAEDQLARCPFRVFTSLLRLELIQDPALRAEAQAILARRRIFSDGALRLIDRAEYQGGLTSAEADAFVAEALQTFRWHGQATVDAATYGRLHAAHRLIADVVCFPGPHINHLTPRTLDIDRVQAAMPGRGIAAKAVIEGPPARACPILLRQTSFTALAEAVRFPGADGGQAGTHTARFGEIEQRGQALTRKGRALYDRLLAGVPGGDGYDARLGAAFRSFPDDADAIRRQGLGYVRYALAGDGPPELAARPLDELVAAGVATAEPILYEDFLPVSAAGIFQSNLGEPARQAYASDAARGAFVAALGAPVIDEFDLYDAAQARSIAAVRAALRCEAAA